MKRLLVIFIMLAILFYLSSFTESVFPGNTFSFTIEQEKKIYQHSEGIIDYLLNKLSSI